MAAYMGCEYIEVRGFPPSRDPVNIHIYDTTENVLGVLKAEGFAEVSVENPAFLRGRAPNASLGKAFVQIAERISAEIMRYHVRLWIVEMDDGVVGNAHVDLPTPIGHVANHDWGRNYIVELFLRRGYWATFDKCEGRFDGFDGYVAKIFKDPCKKKT